MEDNILAWKPEAIAVELCPKRLQVIEAPHVWREEDLFSIIKQKKAALLLLNLILSGFQKKMGQKTKSPPGMEMKRAVALAKEQNVALALVDRDVSITLQRTWRGLSSWEKLKIPWYLMFGGQAEKKLGELEIEELLEEQTMSELILSLQKTFPSIKRTLLDERDSFMAEKILLMPEQRVLAVVGAAHLQGLEKKLRNQTRADLSSLSVIPRSYGYLWGFLIPALLLGALVYGWKSENPDFTRNFVLTWIAAHSLFAALGTILAGGRLASILTAVLIAPFTALQPIIKTGWVVGLVEVFFRKPRTKDFESLTEDVTSLKGFYKNRVTRILLVTLFSNLGGRIGTVLSITWLVSWWK